MWKSMKKPKPSDHRHRKRNRSPKSMTQSFQQDHRRKFLKAKDIPVQLEAQKILKIQDQKRKSTWDVRIKTPNKQNKESVLRVERG